MQIPQRALVVVFNAQLPDMEGSTIIFLSSRPSVLHPIVSCLQDFIQYLSFPVFLNIAWGSEVSAGPAGSSNLCCALGPNLSHNCQSQHDSAPCNNGVAGYLHLPFLFNLAGLFQTLCSELLLHYLTFLILSFNSFPLLPQSSLYFIKYSDILIISLFLDPIIN